MRSDILLFGTGSLARAVAYNMAASMVATPVRLLVVGRGRANVDELTAVARGRAGAMAQPHLFDACVADWADSAVAGALLAEHRPKVVVIAASEQSPWDLADPADGWAQLVKQGGFGLTLPFNASLAAQVFLAANAASPRPFVINACYPDAVNGLLAALAPGDRLMGMGNAAILESLCRADAGSQAAVRVVGHHRHLGELMADDERDPPLIEVDGEPVSPAPLARALRAIRGKELNWVTGAAVSRLLLALIGEGRFSGSVPGPLGEAGGYPVTLRDGAIAFDLPRGLSMAAARDVNDRAALREGVVVQDGSARFSPAAREALSAHGVSFAEGFSAPALADVLGEWRDLRARLSGRARS